MSEFLDLFEPDPQTFKIYPRDYLGIKFWKKLLQFSFSVKVFFTREIRNLGHPFQTFWKSMETL